MSSFLPALTTPYAAGGIRTTVAATRAATDEQLLSHAARLVQEMLRQGTTTVEIKSGYGLSVRDEARSLAVARQLTEQTTFLGAHVVPQEHADDPAGYVDLVTGPMLEACAPHARWIDAFCERGAFDADQARAVLDAGEAAGLRGRLHANQLGPGPGVRLACERGLLAVDHCTYSRPRPRHHWTSTVRTASAGWCPGDAPTWCCSTRPPTCTWPIAPASRSSPASGSAGGRCSDPVRPPAPGTPPAVRPPSRRGAA